MNQNELQEQATARLLEEPKPVIDANDVFREARKLHASSMAFYYQQPTHSARHLRRRQSSARMQFASAPRDLSSARFKDTAEHAHAMLMRASDSDEEGPAGLQAGASMPKAIVLKPRPAFGSIIARQQATASPDTVPSGGFPHRTFSSAAQDISSCSVIAATAAEGDASAAAASAEVAACPQGRASAPQETLEALNARLQAKTEAAVEASKRWTAAPSTAKAAQSTTLGEQLEDARAAAAAAAADAEVQALAEALWGQERRRHAALVPLLSSPSIVRRGGSGSGSGGERGERSRPQLRWSTAAAGEAPPPEGAQELTLSDFPARALSDVPASPRSGAGFPPLGETATPPLPEPSSTSSRGSRWQAASAAPSTEASASAPVARPDAEDCGAGACGGAAAISDQLVLTGLASPVAAATAGGSLAGGMPVVPAGASGRARRLSAPPQLQLSIPSWASDAAAAGGSSSTTGLITAMTSPKVQWPPPPLLADAAGGSSTRSSHRSSAMGSERSCGMASPVPSVFHSNAVAPQPRPQSQASALPSVSTARSASAASSLASSAVGGGGTGTVPAVRRSAWQKSPSPERRQPCAAQVTMGAAAVTDSASTWQQPVEGKPSSKARFKNQLFSLFGLTSRSSAARVADSSASSSMGGNASSAGAGSGADGAALAACSGRSQRVDGGSGGAGGDGLITVAGLRAVATCSSDDSDDEVMAAVVRAGASFCVGSGPRGQKGGAAGGALHTAALLRSGSSFTAASTAQQQRLAGTDAASLARRCTSSSRSIGKSSLARDSQQQQHSPTAEGNGGGSSIFASAGRRVQQQALRQSVLKRSAVAAAAAAAAVAATSPPESPTASPTHQSRASSPKEGQSRGGAETEGQELPGSDQQSYIKAVGDAGAAFSGHHVSNALSPESPFASRFAAATAGEHAAACNDGGDGSGAGPGPHSAPCTRAPPSPQHYRQGDIPCAPSLTLHDASMASLCDSRRPAPPPARQQHRSPPRRLPLRHRSSGAQLQGWSSISHTAASSATPAAAPHFSGEVRSSVAAAAAASAAAVLVAQHNARRRSMDSGCSARPNATSSPAPASEADARAMLTRVARIAAVPTGDAAEPVWEVRPRDVYAHEADEIRLIRVRARAAEATAPQRDLSRRAHSTHAESWRPQGPECAHAFGFGDSHGMPLSRAATPMAAAPQAGLHSPPAAGRAAPGSLNGSSAGDGASLAGFRSPFTLSAVPAAVVTGARMAGLSAAAPLLPSAQLSANSSGIHSNRPTPSFPRRSLAMGSGKFAAVFGDDGGAGGGSVSRTLLAAKDPSGGGLLISPLCSMAAADASAGAMAVIPGRLEDPEGCCDSPLDPLAAAAEGGAGGRSSPHLGAAAPCFRSADNTAGAYQQWQGSASAALKSGDSSMRRRRRNSSTGGCAVGSDAEGGPGCGDGGHNGTGRTSNQGPLPASTGGLQGPSGGAWPAAGSSTAAARAPALWRSAAPSSGTTSPLQLPSASSARLSYGALSGLVLPPPSPPGWAGGQQARLLHQQLPGLQQLQFPGRRGSMDETGASGAYQQQQRLHSAHRRAGPQSAHQPRHATTSPPHSSSGPASAGVRLSSREAGYGGAGPSALVGSGGSRRASTGSLPPRHHSGNPLYVRQAAGNLSLRMGAGASLNAAAAAAAVAACGDGDDDSDSDYDIGYGAMELIPERVGSSGGETSPPASPPLAAAVPAIAQGPGDKAGKELAAAGCALSTTGTQHPGAMAAARHHSDSHGAGTGGISSNGGLSREVSNGDGRGGFVGRLKKKALSFLRRNA